MYMYMKIYSNNYNHHHRNINFINSYWKRLREGSWGEWAQVKRREVDAILYVSIKNILENK